MSNPDETAARGNWSDPAFLDEPDRPEPAGAAHAVRRLPRPRLGLPRRLQEGPPRQSARPRRRMSIAARRQRRWPPVAMPLPEEACTAPPEAGTTAPTNRDGVPVHLLDIHLEKGMHCVDCHFVQDAHGNTRLTGEVRAGHRDPVHRLPRHASQRATLRTTGPASYTSSPEGGRDLAALRTPSGKRRFERAGDKIYPELDGRGRPRAGRSCRPPTRSTPSNDALQRQVGAWPRRCASRPDGQDRSGATCRRTASASLRPRQREHELHRLPFVVEPELLRLPPAAEGQQEDAEPAQRGRRDAATTSPTTSRRCATTCSCWPATAT